MVSVVRELVFKYIPILAGLALAVAVFVVEPGIQRQLAIGGVVVFAILLWAVSLISKNLPADLRMEPTSEPIPDGLAQVCEQLRRIGFEQIGSPMHVNVAPPALVVAFAHAREQVYATAFVAGATKVVAFDMISIFEDDRGGLTSSPNRLAANLPAQLGSFRQISPDASPERLYAVHLDSLAYLREHTIATRPVGADTFERDFTMSMQRQREAFLRAPFLYAAVVLKRAVAPTTKYMVPLRDQVDTRRDLERLFEARGDLPRASARFRD
jgi:hypothetical protein